MAKGKTRKKKNDTEAPESRADGARAEAAEEAVEGDDASRSDSDEGDRIERRLEELEQELEEVRNEAADAADRAVRTLAEFDNYRRRNERERTAAAERGAAEVLEGLLDVADNLDRALEHAGDGVPESFVEGMRLVARGLHDLLSRHRVVRIDAVGQPFDPEVHEALSSQPTDEAAPNTVLLEVQTGYRMGERVLRPAKVIVAAATAPQEADGNESGP